MRESQYIRYMLFLLVMTFGVAVAGAPAKAEESFLRKYFPILFGEDNEKGPEDTLVAPFAEDQAQKERQNMINPPKLGDPDKPLSEPHLSYPEIQNWAMDKVSKAMNVEQGTFQSTLEDLRPHFTDSALQAYISYLEVLNIEAELRNGDKILSTIIIDRPVLTYWDDSCKQLISEFLQNERYHWRFDMSVIYTLQDKSVLNFTETTARDGQETEIRVLVGRASSEDHPDGLVIKDWGPAAPC